MSKKQFNLHYATLNIVSRFLRGKLNGSDATKLIVKHDLAASDRYYKLLMLMAKLSKGGVDAIQN